MHAHDPFQLALLALRRGLVGHAQLLEAWGCWRDQPDGSLADQLVRRGWISAQQRDELLTAAPGGGEAAVASAAAHPDDARRAFEVLGGADPWDSDDGDEEDEAPGRYARTELYAKGGMGLVWRARDARLGRQVALKELRIEYGDQPELRRRFLAEARITAQLEHPGIVPVYDVVERAGEAPYYTMRLVRGRTLSEAVRDFHRRRTGGGRPDWVALRDLLGVLVAVCHTLAYAHARGVVHRDLKGANVALGPFGEVEVLDWGLAKVLPAGAPAGEEGAVQPLADGEVDPTRPGGVSGTPAYMAPEQAKGEVDRLDARTDVFGLGAMLYEVLTGRPPFQGATEEQTQEQARECRVVPPRQRARWVPRPLEAVCLKAMAKEPGGRYATAAELADELKRWLAGEPVRAWREPLGARAGRWVRGHRVLAASVAVALAAGLALGGGGLAWWQQQQALRQGRARGLAERALEQAVEERGLARWGSARALLEQAEQWAKEAEEDAMKGQVRQARADFELVYELNQVREKATTLVDGKWRPWQVREQYPEVFKKHGLDVLEGELDPLAERIRASAVRAEILAALDDWTTWELGRGPQRRLLEVTWRADEASPWRRELLKPGLLRDPKRVRALVSQLEREGDLAPATLAFLSHLLWGAAPEAISFLARAQERHPADFWLTLRLASRLSESDKTRRDEAIGYYRSARALRPGSSVAHGSLGNALVEKGDLDGAVRSLREAVRLAPDDARAHTNLGVALYIKGDPDGSARSLREAVLLDPKYAVAHSNLGATLLAKGDPDGAVRHLREAVRLDPKYAKAHNNLGLALQDKRDLGGALASYRWALLLDPKDAKAHYNLGLALREKGDLDGAVRHLREAVRLDPKLAPAHTNLGLALYDKGDLDGALASHRRALRLDPKDAAAHNNLGLALTGKGDWGGAVASFREAIRLGPKLAPAHTNLGEVLRVKGDLDGAVRRHREAIRLDPKSAKAHYNLGLALYGQRDLGGSVASYREAIRLDPKFFAAHNNLGSVLREKGDLDEAVRHLREAIRLDPQFAPTHTNLGNALRERGELDEAVASYREAIRLDPKYPQAHAALGQVLLASGDFAAARDAARRCLDLLPPKHPLHRTTLGQLAACEKMLQLERRLNDVLAGKAAPASAEERIRLARVGVLPAKRQYAAVVGLYAEAFKAKPGLAEDVSAGRRYDAACAAAGAGTGRGKGADKLDTKERVRLRRQALAWLTDDLAAHAKRLAGPAPGAAESRKLLTHWRRDPDLAAVRDEDKLAELPEAERADWRALWARVDKLLAKPEGEK